MKLTRRIRVANPVVNILIPVCKVPEKYLRKCIESCISQTLYDIKVIILDDRSPDNCGILCDDYATRDHRIKVIYKENGGLSAARHTSFDSAWGDYITFMDGNDFIESKVCEILMRGTTPKKDCVVMRKTETIRAALFAWSDLKKTVGKEIRASRRCLR